MNNYLLGAHVSCAKDEFLVGAVKEAKRIGANTLMLYTGAPQTTIRSNISLFKIDEAKFLAKQYGLDYTTFVCHAPYLINLCSLDEEKHNVSMQILENELSRCEAIGFTRFVLHPGASLKYERKEALNELVRSLDYILPKHPKVYILIETMAGKGSEVCCTLDEVKYVYQNVHNKENLGFCLDTCHLFDSGQDITNFDSYLTKFNESIPLTTIKCIHINDSKNDFGSRKDRHENIGKGKIGLATLAKIVQNPVLKDIPKILETPLNEEKTIYIEEIQLLNKFIE